MKEINLVISGGGVKLFYFIGMYYFFKKLQDKKIIKFKSYSAISSGSVFIVLMACNINIHLLLKTYKKYIILFHQRHRLCFSKMLLLKHFLYEILPKDAHILCTNKVYISMTQIDSFPRKVTFNKFKSKKDLIEILLASSSFPFLVNKNIYYKYKNHKYIDGCFTDNTPIIKSFDTIIFKPFLTGRINLFSLEKLSDIKNIKKGFDDTKKFFLNTDKTLSLDWYKNESSIYKYILYFIKNE